MASTPATILLAGDQLRDQHLYAGDRRTLNDRGARGTVSLTEPGSAALLHRLLEAVLEKDRFALLQAGGVTGPDGPALAHAVWTPRPVGKNGKMVWRTTQPLGFGGDPNPPNPAPPAVVTAQPALLVLADGNHAFRHTTNSAAWHLDTAPARILLKTTLPEGDLWHALSSRHADRLVVLFDAQDLRREAVGIPRGLSWDAAVLGLRDALLTQPRLAGLAKARHLVITFAVDGALWLDARDAGAPRATLIFDAGGAEGEWQDRFDGGCFGFQTVMAAALARQLVGGANPDDLAPAIETGLAAMRDLAEEGHGPVDPNAPPTGFPVQRLADRLRTGIGGFARAPIPWPRAGEQAPPPNPHWMLAEEAVGGGVSGAATSAQQGLARMVLRRGTRVLDRLPHARFGALLTADRAEIETLRHFRRLLRAHAADPRPKRPLSLGVFGPPGAGKSFGVKELSRAIFGDAAWLEFNLSQFEGPSDLHGAFHQLRDRVLSGITPVAFWDEFDSQDLRWLQYLLAPMQDGRFQSGQLTHELGKCVFIFAGGTRPSFAEFAIRPDDQGFVKAKGPDFTSRLDAHLDVLGPNQRMVAGTKGKPQPDPDDRGVALRRALLMRGQLRLSADAPLEIDPGLLRALLTVEQYRHGSRSLEKLGAALARSGPGALRRSDLPALAQLAMHVNTDEFLALLQPRDADLATEADAKVVEIIAKAIHERWRQDANASGSALYNRTFDKLDEAGREENRAAARRMPAILALAGLTLCPAPGLPDDTVRDHLERNLERLAEAEHEGWMAQRQRHGWTRGCARDDDGKRHPSLCPYADLPETEKAKDRAAVRHYPALARAAKMRIGWIVQAVPSGAASPKAVRQSPTGVRQSPKAVKRSRKA